MEKTNVREKKSRNHHQISNHFGWIWIFYGDRSSVFFSLHWITIASNWFFSSYFGRSAILSMRLKRNWLFLFLTSLTWSFLYILSSLDSIVLMSNFFSSSTLRMFLHISSSFMFFNWNDYVRIWKYDFFCVWCLWNSPLFKISTANCRICKMFVSMLLSVEKRHWSIWIDLWVICRNSCIFTAHTYTKCR